MTTSAIIDCDPGHDDVMAILLGARTLDLKGITTFSATRRSSKRPATPGRRSSSPN